MEQHIERINKLVLQNNALMREAYRDMLAMYDNAGSTVNGLASMIYNKAEVDLTDAEKAFAQAVFDNGSAWNQICNTIDTHGDTLRVFT